MITSKKLYAPKIELIFVFSRTTILRFWKRTRIGGGSNVHETLSQEDSYPTQSMEGLAQPMPMSVNLHENGKGKKVMGKLEEKEAKLGKSSVEKPVAKCSKEWIIFTLHTSHFTLHRLTDTVTSTKLQKRNNMIWKMILYHETDTHSIYKQ